MTAYDEGRAARLFVEPADKPEKLPWYEKLAKWRRFALRRYLRRIGDRVCHKHCCCEDCPLSWEERGPEDCDAGCLIYEDLYEGSPGCYMPLVVKKLIKGHIERKREKYEEKQWEGMAEWFQRSEKQQECMRDALAKELPGIELPIDAHARILDRYQDLCKERGLAVEIPASAIKKRSKKHGRKR